MRKLLVCVVGALLVSSPALAEETALDWGGGSLVPGGPGLRIGVDVLGVLPVGDLADIAGAGIGGLARVEVDLLGPLAITGRAGYVYHFDEEIDVGGINAGQTVDSSFSEIPILVGAKLIAPGGLYGALEVGLVRLSVDTDVPNPGDLDLRDESEFNPAGTVGVGLRLGGLDLRGGIHVLDLGNIDESLEFGVSVGFNFITL